MRIRITSENTGGLLSISVIFASAFERVQSPKATTLRDLDAFEEFFGVVEQRVNTSHAFNH